mmetsp:Transcript_80217/g.141587  ORF Transcript_80217/g.141587 Transcript_80217/m.141587 type:complete len:283 (-) Transcript_80217:735-1583(-)
MSCVETSGADNALVEIDANFHTEIHRRREGLLQTSWQALPPTSASALLVEKQECRLLCRANPAASLLARGFRTRLRLALELLPLDSDSQRMLKLLPWALTGPTGKRKRRRNLQAHPVEAKANPKQKQVGAKARSDQGADGTAAAEDGTEAVIVGAVTDGIVTAAEIGTEIEIEETEEAEIETVTGTEIVTGTGTEKKAEAGTETVTGRRVRRKKQRKTRTRTMNQERKKHLLRTMRKTKSRRRMRPPKSSGKRRKPGRSKRRRKNERHKRRLQKRFASWRRS